MNAYSLTPVQQDLLRLFSFDHTDKFAKEIKSVLNAYFQKKIDQETELLWDNGILNQDKLNSIRKEDLHAK